MTVPCGGQRWRGEEWLGLCSTLIYIDLANRLVASARSAAMQLRVVPARRRRLLSRVRGSCWRTRCCRLILLRYLHRTQDIPNTNDGGAIDLDTCSNGRSTSMKFDEYSGLHFSSTFKFRRRPLASSCHVL